MHMFYKDQHRTSLRHNEQGFASMVIGLVLIVVLGLMTVGFAELARHEQQQALSNQLSKQAFYSAETGINDVVQGLSDPVNSVKLTALASSNTGKCMPTTELSDALGGKSNTIGAVANGFSYTCVKLDLKTDNLVFHPVAADKGRTIVTNTDPATLNSLTFAWKPDPDGADKNKTVVRTSAIGTYTNKDDWANPPSGGNGSPAVIQLSITPLGGVNGYDRSSLVANTYTVFLYPNNSNNAAVYSAGGVAIASGKCSVGSPPVAGFECATQITGLGGTTGPYLIHFVNLYTESSIQITGESAGSPAMFSGGQATVDVTGKAKNVLKRLQVRVPISGNDGELSNYAIEAQDICKRMTTQPGSTDFWAPNGALAGSKTACNPY